MTKFQVGEQVLVEADLGQENEVCCFGVVPNMLEFCGRIVTISEASTIDSTSMYYGRTTGKYRLLEDPDGWSWCDNCFEPLQPEIKDVDFDISELL